MMDQRPTGPEQPRTAGSPYSPHTQGHAEPPRRRQHRNIAAAAIGGAVAAVCLGLGIGLAAGGSVSTQGTVPPPAANPAQVANATTARATAAQEVGVVDINTILRYQGAHAAGTGMILTPSGEVLTNNHVIDGATSIRVTVASTGATYPAEVVGTDPTADVAVLHLLDASGLQTAKIGTSSGVSAGDPVTAVGNAEGRGGTPIAAKGTVIATGQTLTADNGNSSNAETLTDMIEINADVVPGDSGGPLYAANGTIVGMDTAASAGSGHTYPRYGHDGSGSNARTTAYAIPIDRAGNIATEIESGHETGTVHIGYPAFLGVSLQDSFHGPVITAVANGTPAAEAGLLPGDVITSVDGQAVMSASSLSSIIAAHHPGDQLQLTWIAPPGQPHTATVALATGPAD